ncbi:MAG: hypothetical protein IPQ13_10690 [Holophagaceae bacterium]|nr:hypothetical protein [Holophagaceae bacterium]
MPSSISFDAASGFITVAHHGTDDEASLRNILFQVIGLIKEQGCYRVLSDYRDALVHMPPAAIYEYPKEATEAANAAGIDPQKIRHAVLMSAQTPNLADFEFYETVSFNRGRKVKGFIDRDQAIGWLTEK